jgi:glycosidase
MRLPTRWLTLAACLALACTPAPPPAPAEPAALLAPDTSWVARSAIYELFVRDFSTTGDFRGVIEGLDRVAASGVNVIWLMPIHPIGVAQRKGTLGSPYAVRDYYAINPDFGVAEDFQALVQAVHDRGMRLIIDWVPNHTSPDAEWVTAHPDFHVRDSTGAVIEPRNAEGQPTGWTDVAQLDYGNPAMRQAMIDAMRHWLVEYDIDGFRVDVAGFVPDSFWQEALPALRAAVPRPILLLAEWGDVRMHEFGFDLTYGWDGYARLKAVWDTASAAAFVAAEVADLQALPPGAMRLRFTTNHDETAWDAPPLDLFGGVAGARAAFVAMALLPGRPLLYNGQEVESPVRLRLFERDTIAWQAADASEARAFYQKVLQLIAANPSFNGRDLAAVETSAPDDVIAYRRGEVVVLVNARPRELRFSVTSEVLQGRIDALSGKAMEGQQVVLPPHGAVVLMPPAN